MDAKIPARTAERAVASGWLSRAFSSASRALSRTPLEEALRVYSILDPSFNTRPEDTQRSHEHSMRLGQGGVPENGLGENSGLRA
jgi:hypothetical protein